MQVQSLGQEDPLEEGMTTHSSILAWKIPWTEESGRLRSMVHGVHRAAQQKQHKCPMEQRIKECQIESWAQLMHQLFPFVVGIFSFPSKQ